MKLESLALAVTLIRVSLTMCYNPDANDFIDNISPIFCNKTESDEIDKILFPRIDTIVADCDSNGFFFAEVKCDCCTSCEESTFGTKAEGNEAEVDRESQLGGGDASRPASSVSKRPPG